MRTATDHTETNVVVETTGTVPAAEEEHARAVFGRLLAHTAEPVPYVRIRLTVIDDPALPRPALVQVTVDLDGRIVTAHAAAPTVAGAVGLTRDRLAVRVERAGRTWRQPYGRRPE